VEFLKTDLDVGITFVKIALGSQISAGREIDIGSPTAPYCALEPVPPIPPGKEVVPPLVET